MGNPNDQPKSSSSFINHFSHSHPLQLSNQSHNPIPGSPCSGCKLDVSGGLVYNCTTCNYFLHAKCSQMPQQITHPSDPNHVLSLLSKPHYPGGVFNCDACGQKGNGFSYHCQSCSLDYHILCASMPMTYIHQSHQHQLNLTFSPPYPTKTFSCDLCKRAGSNHWLYRCSTCDFDVHLTCINIRTSQHPAQQYKSPIQQTGPNDSFHPQFQQPLVTRPMFQLSNPNNFVYSPVLSSRPQAQVFSRPPPTQQSLLPMQNSMNFGSAGYGRQNTLMGQIISNTVVSFASGVTQSIIRAMIPGSMGGGNGGNGGHGGHGGGGMFDSGSHGISHLQDFGGGVGDMNGYDVMAMDPGTNGSLDYGYDQNDMDGGIMADNMNQMMDASQFDPGMVGGDMSNML